MSGKYICIFAFGHAKGIVMRLGNLVLGVFGLLLMAPMGATGQDGRKPQPAPARPAVYYANNDEFKGQVRLSDEMATKVAEILRGKPKPWERDLKVAPRGYFSVDGKVYPYYGFLTSHVSKGDSWHDPALLQFWDELSRVESKDGLGPLKDFKP